MLPVGWIYLAAGTEHTDWSAKNMTDAPSDDWKPGVWLAIVKTISSPQTLIISWAIMTLKQFSVSTETMQPQ